MEPEGLIYADDSDYFGVTVSPEEGVFYISRTSFDVKLARRLRDLLIAVVPEPPQDLEEFRRA
jgi:hypothetical protein